MTAPTQRPASTSDARKRLAENTPAEPDADERLRERAEAFLVQCGPCDAGLPTGCSCPDADPRPVIAELLAALASRTPDAHLAAAKAEAWSEGMRTGTSRAMRKMSDEPALPLASEADNPYRARAARLREQGGE